MYYNDFTISKFLCGMLIDTGTIHVCTMSCMMYVYSALVK